MRRLAAVLAAAPAPALAASQVPQLDFANPLTTSQVIWGAVIFGAFYVLMRNSALPAVASVLEARAARIAADLDASRDAKARSDAALAELTQAIDRARAEGTAAVTSAVAQAKARAAEQAAAQAATLEARLHEADHRIAAQRADAVHAVRAVAADTTKSVIARLTGLAPDDATIDAAVARHLPQAA